VTAPPGTCVHSSRPLHEAAGFNCQRSHLSPTPFLSMTAITRTRVGAHRITRSPTLSSSDRSPVWAASVPELFDNLLTPLNNRLCGERMANKRVAHRPHRRLWLTSLFRQTAQIHTPSRRLSGFGGRPGLSGRPGASPLFSGTTGIHTPIPPGQVGDSQSGPSPGARELRETPHSLRVSSF
jgi:hypothetical protein